ncbi:MAG: hypothetical protein IKB80_01365 [Oscillospiraceae bacterium]|nr:hypothetical protein [Oscillospiraceae bacterium]
MRKFIYALIIAALCFAPLKRADIAKLRPVQAFAMYMEDNNVVLETDTGDLGRGENFLSALENLKEKTAAVVYLDTAEFLLVAENAVSRVGELAQHIKHSVKVCVCEAAGRVKEAAQYLDVHGNLPKLRDWIGEK